MTNTTTAGTAPITTVKPGYKTTEFYVALIGKVVGILVLLGVVKPGSGIEGAGKAVVEASGGLLMAVSALGYSISRGLTKKGALTNTPTAGDI